MRAILILTLMLATPSARAEYAGGPVMGGGKITGTVKLAGERPALPPRERDRSPEICGASGADESLVVDGNGGVKNAIVYLKDIAAGKPLHPGTADLDQKGCTYVPHVLAVAAGTTVNLLNDDALLHNIHAEGATAFNYAMPMAVKKIPKKLSHPGFLSLRCDVHSWMSGAIGVMENPYFAVTGADGSFTLDDVPPGTYTLGVWHETLHELTQKVTVTANGSTAATVTFNRSSAN